MTSLPTFVALIVTLLLTVTAPTHGLPHGSGPALRHSKGRRWTYEYISRMSAQHNVGKAASGTFSPGGGSGSFALGFRVEVTCVSRMPKQSEWLMRMDLTETRYLRDAPVESGFQFYSMPKFQERAAEEFQQRPLYFVQG